MTEREKLADLILNAPKLNFPVGSRAQGKTYQTALNMADHLLANGVGLIVPPCKVGDMLYQPYCGKILEYEVTSFSFRVEGLLAHTHSKQTGGLHPVWCASIGKTYFTKRHEAEAVLAAWLKGD